MKKSYLIPRRSFLRGAGVCISLPALEIMGSAIAPLAPCAAKEANSRTPKIPLRLGVFHKGNGIDPESWKAEGSESDFELSGNLAPLRPVQNDVVVLSNVSNQAKGDHYGAMPLFMTGVQSRNPGQTFDQVIADQVGRETQFPSFQLSADPVDVRSTTLNSLAYDKEGRAKFVERNAQFAFDRLFRGLADNRVREPKKRIMKKTCRLQAML